MATEIGFPDHTLIMAIKAGDEKILANFYKDNFGKILHMVLKNSGNNDDAKDIYQEAMIEVLQQIRKGKLDQLGSKLSTYLYSVCHHKWIDRLRQKGRMVPSGFDTEIEPTIVEDEVSPYHQALENVMQRIGDKCRNLLVAFYYEKLPLIQIAGKLGFADDNSAKSQKNKCMDKARSLGKSTLQKFYN